MMSEIQIKGYARLYVSADMAPEGETIPPVGRITFTQTQIDTIFERWHTHLQLPDSYTVIGVYFDVAYYQWLLIVEADGIPRPDQGQMLPQLMPVYCRENGVTSIVKLDLLR